VTSPTDLLRRHLRQSRELGQSEWVLDRLTAVELLELVERLSSARHSGRQEERASVSVPNRSRRGAETAGVPAKAAVADADRVTNATDVEAPGHRAEHIIRLGELDSVRQTAMGCMACRLAQTRKRVVFGEGSETAEVMVVGEAPGAEEDRTGRPFVGRAGQLLDLLLASVGFPRESVYICNVLKCRPPGNRDPQPDEIEACSAFLHRQVELIAPRVILTVGTFPSQTLLGTREPINRLRGRVHQYRGRPLIPTFHPAALLRNPGWIRPVWEDLQRLRSVLDGDAAHA